MPFDRLVGEWTNIWNGNLALIDSAIHPDFIAHAAPLTGGPATTTEGRDHLRTWVSANHTAMDDLRFTTHVGPFVDDPFIVLRWHAQGREIEFYGTDILRVVDGKIAEYWVNSDSLWFAQQMGIGRARAQKQPCGNLFGRLASGYEPRDVHLLDGEFVEGVRRSVPRLCARRAQFVRGTAGEGVHPDGGEHLVRSTELVAGVSLRFWRRSHSPYSKCALAR
ncbi:ester cyclase [Kibdelosporangium philippinense]|uniref:Ester cyclase n=1 Tax=Kibdelosporangium philippinense TaxID=211113 RepID=A0ABS8ZRW0_9PSEU|nr:nuclear transport factor 2 family protein [Kibdelosporangium philippinense]MCE7010342.1 ester cyclase [Kibdelosporangium philippinense]